MAQLHYYGSVFNLAGGDNPEADEYWTEVFDLALHEVEITETRGRLIVTIEGGRRAEIPIWPGCPIVLVAHGEPVSLTPGELGVFIPNKN